MRAPDVGVLNGGRGSGSHRQRLAFQPMPEDGLDALVAEGAQGQSADTGRLQPLRSVMISQP